MEVVTERTDDSDVTRDVDAERFVEATVESEVSAETATEPEINDSGAVTPPMYTSAKMGVSPMLTGCRLTSVET